jgi:hypothetical protein
MDWELTLAAAHTEKGENDIDEPFVPGSPRVDSVDFEGVVEKTLQIGISSTWQPASGVRIGIATSWRHVSDANHVEGVTTDGMTVALDVRLVR